MPQSGSVLGSVKAKPKRARQERGLDSPSAHRRLCGMGRDEETGNKSNQEIAVRKISKLSKVRKRKQTSRLMQPMDRAVARSRPDHP